MHVLEAVSKHRPIDLVEQTLVDPDFIVRGDSQQHSVIGGMVDLAQAQPVRHDGITTVCAVLRDVGRVEQLRMLERAHAARALVREITRARKAGWWTRW